MVPAHRGVEDELAGRRRPVGGKSPRPPREAPCRRPGRGARPPSSRRHPVAHRRDAAQHRVAHRGRERAAEVRAVVRLARERVARRRRGGRRGRRRRGSRPRRPRARRRGRVARDPRSCARSLAIAAGRRESRSNSWARSTTSGPPSASTVSPSACWRPSIPDAASSNGRSLASGGCGAWSVATASIAPSRRSATSAATCSSVRSGGLTLNAGSKSRQAVVQGEVVRGGLAGDGEPSATGVGDEPDRGGRGEVQEVQRGAGELDEPEVARDDRRLGELGLAAKAELGGPRALVHHAARRDRGVLAVLRAGRPRARAAYSSALRMRSPSGTHAPSSVNSVTPSAAISAIGARDAPAAAEGDRTGDRDVAGGPRRLKHVRHDRGRVAGGLGVGHGDDGRVAAERAGPRARLDRLGLLSAGLAQVRVQVDEPGPDRAARRVEHRRVARCVDPLAERGDPPASTSTSARRTPSAATTDPPHEDATARSRGARDPRRARRRGRGTGSPFAPRRRFAPGG